MGYLIDIFNGIRIKVKSQKELDTLANYTKKLGYKWKTGADRVIISEQDFPIIVKFENYIMTWCNSLIDYNFRFSDIFIPSVDRITAREFLEKFINQIDCHNRGCENCKFSGFHNKLGKQLCNSDIWDEDDINYLIELVLDDDPIYHLPMDNIRAANFIDDVLGGKELSKEEEEALKFAAEKLREMK